jgi:UDP-glucose 4-epimerase
LKLLITGASGYLGGRLVNFFSENSDHSLLIGSRSSQALDVTSKNIRSINTFWSDPKKLAEICSDVDIIIHLAGMNSIDCSRANALELAEDIQSTRNLLNAAIQKKVRRFIYLSTVHVYGELNSKVITESSKTLNVHPYATNHRMKEDLVLQAHETQRIDGVVIRLSNAFGPPINERTNCWMLLVNDLCRQVVNTGNMILHSSGQQSRDFITISDFCLAINHMININKEELDDGLFNLCGMWVPTVLEMTQHIAYRFFLLTGIKPKISHQKDLNNHLSKHNFSIKKMIKSGYIPSTVSKVDSEIDHLLLLCMKHKASN